MGEVYRKIDKICEHEPTIFANQQKKAGKKKKEQVKSDKPTKN